MSMSSLSRLSLISFLAAAVSVSFLAISAQAEDQLGNLHLCNADEITSIPELQSDSANDCINDQNTEATPKALMCGVGKSYCCTQKVDQISDCKPIVAGRKRSVPLREPGVTPEGEPNPNQTLPGIDNGTLNNTNP